MTKEINVRRGDLYIKIITAVLFVAVVSYIGVYVYNALINTYVTTPALSYSIEESCRVEGYIIRAESVIDETGSAILPIVGEGEKVASGQAIAVEYMSREALETASELRALKLRIAQLETPGGTIEALCFDSIMLLSTAVHRGDLSGLDELSLNIESYIFSGGVEQGSELPALRERLAYLESRTAGVRTIYAPFSGVFSQVVDGFERVRPISLADILPADLSRLFRSSSAADRLGKLITEFRWYFAAVMDESDAARLSAGRNITIQFSGAYNAAVDMRVESVGDGDEGECVVVFSSDRSIHEIAALRFVRADVIFDTVSGIRVPREAIHLDEEATTFVYLETGVRAERVDVEILLDAGDSYLVRDGAESGTPLRDGATIIVKANGLFDGKVVG